MQKNKKRLYFFVNLIFFNNLFTLDFYELLLYNGNKIDSVRGCFTMLSIYLAMLEDPNDAERFEKIYNRYKADMSRIAVRVLNDEEMAFDAVHSALISIARNIKRIPATDADYERNYIYKIVRRAALYEKRKHASKIIPLNIEDYTIDTDEYAPDNLVIENEDVECLFKTIVDMPEIYRDVLIARCVYGLNINETASFLNVSVNTIKARFIRGKKILTEIYDKQKGKEKQSHEA